MKICRRNAQIDDFCPCFVGFDDGYSCNLGFDVFWSYNNDVGDWIVYSNNCTLIEIKTESKTIKPEIYND